MSGRCSTSSGRGSGHRECSTGLELRDREGGYDEHRDESGDGEEPERGGGGAGRLGLGGSVSVAAAVCVLVGLFAGGFVIAAAAGCAHGDSLDRLKKGSGGGFFDSERA